MEMDILAHTIMRCVKSLWYSKKRPDRKFIKTAIENMLEYKTTVLYQLWDTDKMCAKKWCEYFSNNLWKECWKNMWEKVEKMSVKLIWNLTKDSVICFDWVDINKNTAKKMQELKTVRDATQNTYWNWYVIHWVSVKWIPLLLDRERRKKDDLDKSIRMDMFRSQVNKINSLLWNWYWILADRLYDDFKKFKLLMEMWYKFSIRLKNTRNVKIIKWEGQWKKIGVWELKEWNYTVKIWWISKELFVFVKYFKWQKNPMRIISNINDEIAVEKYFDRWEIERIFKVWKQEYNLEKVWTHNIQKTENLIHLVQLCLAISAYIYRELKAEIKPKKEFWKERIFRFTTSKIIKKIKPFLKKKSLNFNRNSITNFLGYYMKFIRKTKVFFKITTLKQCVSSQLSLFT